MNAAAAKELTNKNLKGPVIKPYLDHIYKRIEIAANEGCSCISHPFYGLRGNWPTSAAQEAIWQELRANGYKVRHIPNPDQDIQGHATMMRFRGDKSNQVTSNMASQSVKSTIPKEIIDYLSLTFKKGKTVKPTTPYRIKFLGEFVTLESGKTLWRTKGHAKSAMVNHIKSKIRYDDSFWKMLEKMTPKNRYKIEFIHEKLMEEGVIEYVPHTETVFMNQK